MVTGWARRGRLDRFTAIKPTDAARSQSRRGAPLRARIRAEKGPLAASDGGDGDPGAWAESSRLRRLAAHVAAQEELVASVGRQLDAETEPLRRLLDRQASAIESVMANLGLRLESVREFAAGEESNLRALQERMRGEGMGFVAHAFSEVVAEQRERIQETRARIDRQREPFERFASDERKTIELALKRFDSDIDALESVLAEQRTVTLRLLDAMRSDDFTGAKDFLLARQQVLEEIAESGITDPSGIATRMQAIRGDQAPDAPQNSRLGEVLENATSADARLMTAGTGASEHATASAAEHTEPKRDAEGDEARAAA